MQASSTLSYIMTSKVNCQSSVTAKAFEFDLTYRNCNYT